MQKCIRAAYFEFHQSPARRAAYTSVTKSTVFPKKFVGIRWLENGAVASALLEILPNLKEFVNSVEAKKITITKGKSYEILVKDLKNMKILTARLEFFVSVARELEPFLREFQGNQPLAPMLYDKLRFIMTSLFKRFMKPEIVDNLKTGSDFVKIDLKKSENHLPVKQVDIGFGAKRALSNDSNISEAVNFRSEARQILIGIGCKLQERSPLKYSMVKFISCLNPTNIWSCTQESVKRFESMCEYMVDTNRISTANADKAHRSWQQLTSSAEFKSSAKEFAKRSGSDDSRLDYFFRSELSGKDEHEDVYNIVKRILVLSHGNAEVERGFSVNKNLIRDNLSEESLIAQRLVHQAIPTDGNKFLDVVIDKQMIGDVRMAWRRREARLEEKRLEKTQEQRDAEDKKRKRDEIQELVSKKKKMTEELKQAMKNIDVKLQDLRK